MVDIEGHPMMLSKPVYCAMVVIVQLVGRPIWIHLGRVVHIQANDRMHNNFQDAWLSDSLIAYL